MSEVPQKVWCWKTRINIPYRFWSSKEQPGSVPRIDPALAYPEFMVGQLHGLRDALWEKQANWTVAEQATWEILSQWSNHIATIQGERP